MLDKFYNVLLHALKHTQEDVNNQLEEVNTRRLILSQHNDELKIAIEYINKFERKRNMIITRDIRVKATREGLLGKRSASGYIIDTVVSFVALPSVHALHKFVMIYNPLNNLTTIAQVLDVGPENEHDDDYVFAGNRPLTEQGLKTVVSGQPPVAAKTNGAGIDLGERVWHDLQMKDNTDVYWRFVRTDWTIS
jgi:hypothetical protein